MEKLLEGKRSLLNSFGFASLLVGIAATMVIILFGVENVIPGVHDVFHDFRHTVGIPCH